MRLIPNSNNENLQPGYNATAEWQAIYLKNATARFQPLVTGYNWTLTDTYAAQTMCPYETVAFGYSPFCALFTADEWKGYEYSIDLQFAGNNGILVHISSNNQPSDLPQAVQSV